MTLNDPTPYFTLKFWLPSLGLYETLIQRCLLLVVREGVASQSYTSRHEPESAASVRNKVQYGNTRDI